MKTNHGVIAFVVLAATNAALPLVAPVRPVSDITSALK
jgi:hypothetical protein